MMRKTKLIVPMAAIAAILLSGCSQTTRQVSAAVVSQESETVTAASEETAKAEAEASSAGTTQEGDEAVNSTGITTNAGTEILFSQLEHYGEGGSTVYYTKDITPEALVAVYEALGWTPEGKTGVKISTGEPPASHYLSPDLMKNLVQMVGGTIVECNTAYGGSRANTAMHKQVAEDHGYTAIADVDILDEDGSMSIPVEGGVRLPEDFVGSHFANYDSYIILSHFKGHAMAGLGGAIKNISIGFGSGSEGKQWIHSGGTSRTSWMGGEQDHFLEAMADAGKGVSDYMNQGKNIIYINVMNNLSVDCDCDGNASAPDMHDIGILASTDPVALDQACVDLVHVSPDSKSLVERMESRNGFHTLESGENIGLGSRSYSLVSIDD